MLKLFFSLEKNNLNIEISNLVEDFRDAFSWDKKILFKIKKELTHGKAWTTLIYDLNEEQALSLIDLVSARFPVSPKYEQLKDLCPELSWKNHSTEWVFFGGSFNPWHQGHQSCLDLLPEEKTCLILPDKNPQKNLMQTKIKDSLIQLIEQIKVKPNQYLAPAFVLEEKTNPTINWIEKFQKNCPKDKPSLLMGFDSFSHLNTWIRINDLLLIISKIYVVSRLETDEQREQAVNKIKEINAKVNIDFLGRHLFEHLSSTQIRNKEGGN